MDGLRLFCLISIFQCEQWTFSVCYWCICISITCIWSCCSFRRKGLYLIAQAFQGMCEIYLFSFLQNLWCKPLRTHVNHKWIAIMMSFCYVQCLLACLSSLSWQLSSYLLHQSTKSKQAWLQIKRIFRFYIILPTGVITEQALGIDCHWSYMAPLTYK